MKDLFDKIVENKGPLGKYAEIAEGYFAFPKLEGPIGNRMQFNGREVITWSVNDYLGLANHPEIRKIWFCISNGCKTNVRSHRTTRKT